MICRYCIASADEGSLHLNCLNGLNEDGLPLVGPWCDCAHRTGALINTQALNEWKSTDD